MIKERRAHRIMLGIGFLSLARAVTPTRVQELTEYVSPRSVSVGSKPRFRLARRFLYFKSRSYKRCSWASRSLTNAVRGSTRIGRVVLSETVVGVDGFDGFSSSDSGSICSCSCYRSCSSFCSITSWSI